MVKSIQTKVVVDTSQFKDFEAAFKAFQASAETMGLDNLTDTIKEATTALEYLAQIWEKIKISMMASPLGAMLIIAEKFLAVANKIRGVFTGIFRTIKDMVLSMGSGLANMGMKLFQIGSDAYKQHTQARALGTNLSEVRRGGMATEMMGGDRDDFTRSIESIAEIIRDPTKGGAVAQLGINPAGLDKDPTKAFEDIMDALKESALPEFQKINIATEQLGMSFVVAKNAINNGSKEFSKYSKELEAVGVVSHKTSKRMALAGYKLETSFGNMKSKLFEALAPSMSKIIEKVTKMMESGKLNKVIDALVVLFDKVMDSLLDFDPVPAFDSFISMLIKAAGQIALFGISIVEVANTLTMGLNKTLSTMVKDIESSGIKEDFKHMAKTGELPERYNVPSRTETSTYNNNRTVAGQQRTNVRVNVRTQGNGDMTSARSRTATQTEYSSLATGNAGTF